MAIYLGTTKLGSVAVGTVDASGTSITLATPVLTLDNNTGIVIATVTQNTSGHLSASSTSNTLSLPTQSTITATPSNSIQTIVDAGKFTLGPIKVAAVSTETGSFTSNGTYTPSNGKYFSSITVNVPTGATINNQIKNNITLSESQQIITPDAGYTGLSQVIIPGISSTYIGSDITIRNSNSLTVNENTVTVPAGYYSATATKTIASASHPNPSISINTTNGLVTATHTQAAGYVSAGSTSATLQLSTEAAKTVTPTTSEQTAVATNKYTLGIIKVGAIQTETATFSNNGTYTPSTGKYFSSVTVNVSSGGGVTINNQDKTVTPTTSQQSVTADSGYTGLGTVTVNAIQTETKSATPSTSVQTITPTSGKYLTSVSIGAIQTETKSAAPSTSAQTITPSSGKYLTSVSISAIQTETKSVTPGASAQTVTPSSGKYLTSVTVAGDSDLIASNIKNGVQIFGVTGTYTASSITPQLQAKTGINPSTSSQTITPDNGYDGLASVQINAMPSGSATTPATTITANPALSTTYTNGSGYAMTVSKTQSVIPTVSVGYINSGTAGTITVSGSGYVPQSVITNNTTLPSGSTSSGTINFGSYIKIGAGYYPTDRYYRSYSTNGSVTAPSSISGTTATISTGTNTLTLTKTISVTPNVTTAGYISSGTAGNSSVSLTANVTTKAAAIITPGTSNQTIASGTYLTGTQTISGDANLIAANIKKDVSIFGVTGSYEGSGSGGGESKNVQVAQSTTRATSSSYTELISLTCTKAGTYDVYWSTTRTSTSGTWGSQLYLGSTAYGSAQTGSWSNNIQNIHLTNVQITANQKVSVRARTRGSNYYAHIGTLVIIEN